MKRLIFVVGGALLLILAGYLLGAKKSSDYRSQLEQAQEEHEAVAAELQSRVETAQSDGDMWRIRAELLVAAQDVSESNYGNASRRIQRVIDHLEERTASGQPEAAALLRVVKDGGDAVLNMDPAAAVALRNAANEIGNRLDR